MNKTFGWTMGAVIVAVIVVAAFGLAFPKLVTRIKAAVPKLY